MTTDSAHVGWLRWVLAGLPALVLCGCPNSVPATARFAAADAGQAADVGVLDSLQPEDAAQPADLASTSDVVPAKDVAPAGDAAPNVDAQDAAFADVPAVDAAKDTATVADAGCAVGGCPPASACHTAICQASGLCTEVKAADDASCGTGKSCHSGICLPDPPKAIRVVAAGVSTCALLEGGTVKCWGDGMFGQLGDGSSGSGATSATPVAVADVAGATDLAIGGTHGCAMGLGKVTCWGSNKYSESMGEAASELQLVPAEVPGLSSLGLPSGIAAGDNHTCAILGQGKVYCWGLGTAGQLGDGLGALGGAVTAVKLSDYAIEVRAGTIFTCARTAFGTAYCWGDNYSGQIGNGKGGTSQFAYSPAKVGDFSDIEALAAGDQHACALRKGGAVWCWGRNNSGELGNNGGNSSYPSPVQAQGQSGVTSIAAGGTHTCAVGAMGGLWCWGGNQNGQAGLNSSILFTKIPKQVVGLDNVVEVAAGDSHTCVRKKEGSIWCWGANSLGQCGIGTGKDVLSPVKAY